MDEEQAKAFAGLVWCPASNYYLFGKTASIDLLKKRTTILFGTDSTLTAGWNAWEHFRMALKNEMVSQDELMDMLTMNAVNVFRFHDQGKISQGNIADLLIIPGGNIFDKNPADILMVIKNGEVQLAGSSMITTMNGISTKIQVDDSVKYVKGEITELINGIKSALPGSFKHKL